MRNRDRIGRLAREGSAWAMFVGLSLLLAAVFQFGAVPVHLTLDGRTLTFRTHAATVADVLIERAVGVAPGDLVVPPAGTRVRAGDRIVVHRARPVRVRADGRVVVLRSLGRSPLAILHEAGVAVAPRDAVAVNGRPWRIDQAVDPSVSRASRPAGAAEASGGASAIARDAKANGSPGGWLPGLAALPFPPQPRVAQAAGLEQAGDGAPPIPSSGLTESGDLPVSRGSADGPAVGDPVGRVDNDDSAAPGGTDVEWVIDVQRAVLVTVVEGGVSYEVTTAGPTIEAGLAAAGITLQPGDETTPPADTPLAGSMRITIWRAVPFVVTTDGESREVRARADTVGAALADAGLALVGHDYSIPAADTALTPGLQVEVIRVQEEIQVVEVALPFASETVADPELPLDEQRVLREGEPGLKSQRVRIVYENGVVVDREVLDETVLREPVAQSIAYGTQVVWRTIDTPEGPKQYWRKLRMWATSYSPARAGTPKSAPWYGRARNGMVMRKGIVATDRSIIPMGMWVYVPGYGVAIAGDTGGGVRNYMIDLGYADDDYVSWHSYVDVYILERLPPEHQMRWVLP